MKLFILQILIMIFLITIIALVTPILYHSNSFTIRRIASVMRYLTSPGYGTCERCEVPWNYIKEHSTFYKTALCNDNEEINTIYDQVIVADGTDFVNIGPSGIERGCFPLCEKCWQELKTPEARLPYYKELFDKWIQMGSGKTEEDWERIKQSVIEGN